MSGNEQGFGIANMVGAQNVTRPSSWAVSHRGMSRPALHKRVLLTTALTTALAGFATHGAHAQSVGYSNTGSIPSYSVPTGSTLSGTQTGANNSGTIGALSNSGTIYGGYEGIYNSSGTSGDTNISGSIGTLSNSGTINGGDEGIYNEGTIDVLSNSGIIGGSGYEGIYNEGSIGTLSNGGTIYDSDESLENEGTIDVLSNSGTIGANGDGVGDEGLENDGTIGVLGNSGTIVGEYEGLENYYSIGTLSNSGLIAGSYDSGIDNDGTIGVLSNSGTISGGDSGIWNPGSIGTLSNSGLITGSNYTGIDNDGTIGVLSNSGTISGDTYEGIYNGGTIGVLSNSGLISGGNGNVDDDDDGYSAGIYNEGTIGALTNSGTISGADFGIFNAYGGSIGTLSNSGTIAGDVGIANYNGSTIGTLINSGAILGEDNGTIGGDGIIGDNVGIADIGGSIGTIINSGTISGGEFAIYVYPEAEEEGPDDVDEPDDDTAPDQIANSGLIAGNIVDASEGGLSISGGSGSTFGTLTGFGGTIGTIAAYNVTFGSGNLLLNDDVYSLLGAVTDQAANLLVNGQIGIYTLGEDDESLATGTLNVAGGELEVGDAADPGAVLTSNISVASGAVLRGHGTIDGDVVSDGVVYPGGSVGTLTVDGNYTQNSDGTLEIELAGTGDELAVTGSASLAGALAVTIDSSAKVGTVYTVLSAAGGTSGAFTTGISVGTGLSAYLTPLVTYDANNVMVELAPTDLAFSSGRIYAASNFAQDNALFGALTAPLNGPGGSDEVDNGYWLHGIGSFGNANGYNINEKGFVIGKGFALSPNLVVGGAVSNIYTSTAGGGSSVDGNSFGALLYGIYNRGPLWISASATVGHIGADLHRGLPSLGETASASSNGAYEGAALRLQYALLNRGPFFVAPYATVSYLHTGLGNARETGAGILDLRYDAMSTSLAEAGAGLTGGYVVPVRYGTLTAWASVGGEGTLGNTHVRDTETLGSLQAGESAIAAPVGAVTPAAGVALAGNGPWSLGATWGGQFGSAASVENFGVQGKYVW